VSSAPITRPDRGARLLEFDVLRGVAIIAVVYLHAYFSPWPGVSEGGLVALRGVHLVAHGAVPLFLFAAAFLQARGGAEGLGQHLSRRTASTWAPIAIWMAATFAFRWWDQGFSGTLLRDLALFDISGQFYFAWLLLVFGVGLTFAHRVPGRWLPWLVAGAFAVNLVTIAWYEWHTSIDGLFATLAYRNPLAWVFFPVFGYWLGRHGTTVLPAKVRMAAIAGMVATAAVYFGRGVTGEAWPVSYFGVTVFLFSACGMVVYPYLASGLVRQARVARPLASLSRYAFPIYLVHVPFVMGFGTRELLGDGAEWSNYWALLHANAIVGLVVSLALVRQVALAAPRLAAVLIGVRKRSRLPGRHGPRAARGSSAA